MSKGDLVFSDRRINEAISRIKIPKYLEKKGSAWIIREKIRKNGKPRSYSLPFL